MLNNKLMETNIGEIWKDIPGYEGYYKVSNLGNFLTVERFKNGKIRPTAPLKTHSYTNFYKCVSLCKNGKPKQFLAHRIVASVFIPNPDNKPQVNHKNGIKWDNRVDNLEWSTLSHNMRHAFNTGLLKPPSCDDHCHAKLTSDDVYNIRSMYDSGKMPITHIAKMYSMVGETIIFYICKRKKWANLPERQQKDEG